ncbi:hypothetical protein HPP92_015777 [Vanilla planifolia]|uniref:PHD-type domain-containing protein n=1 Tax=Vanilla planifolia TaxID=51239 RepID=A0A835UVF2_VANPL|nr:hypothetical protein HPP92_015777 [Vanilla planifolia]
MGDEGREGVASGSHAEESPQPPPAKKRRGMEEELRRVAEIVIVLSAMAEMRAGKEPTAVERGLAAEARLWLTRACEEVRPRDLFSSEAVRVVVEDLGLNPKSDPTVALRPPKMSIAERLQHTMKKMEEPKEVEVSAHSSQQQSMGTVTISETKGPQRSLAGKTSHLVSTVGGFPSSTAVHVPTLASSISSTKQIPPSEVQPVVVKSSFGQDSPSTTAHVEVHQRLDARINGPTYFTLVRSTAVGNYLPEKASASGMSTSAALAAQSQASNSGFNSEVNAIHTSHQMMKNHDKKGSVVHATHVNMAIGNQLSQGLTFVQPTSYLSSHNEIAKNVINLMQRKFSDRPNLSPLSSEYMTKPLNCQVCKVIITDVESLLVCDACEKGTHLKCLPASGTKTIQKSDWHCQKCLLASNGKPFPPKYGRVTRNTVAKATSGGRVSALLEKKGDNPESNFNNQKSKENEIFASSGVSQASNICSTHEETVRGSKMTNENETCESSSNLKNSGGEMYSGTSVTRLEENCGVASATEGTQIGCSGLQETNKNLPEVGTEKSVPESQCVMDTHTEGSMSSPSKMQRYASASVPDVMASESNYSEQKQGTIVNTASQSESAYGMQVTKDDNAPTSIEVRENQTQETNKQVADEMEDASKISETSPRQVLEEGMNCEHRSQAIYENNLGNGSDVPSYSNTLMEETHAFDWVGDILEVIENRTYYNSCCIDGVIVKLQDHILVSAGSQNFYPAKLLSLWEDKEKFSKLATVNQYYLPRDLQEIVSQPLTPEKHEVYASDKTITILATSICGLCDVLSEEQFRIEANRTVEDNDDGKNLIYMCRWTVDVSKGIFQSIALSL